MSYLGIDVGTSQTKAIAFDDSLCVLAQANAVYERSYPRPGWCELDPRELVKAVREVVGRCASACRKDPIAALSFSVFGGGICAIDARRRPLLPIISTTDNRAQAEADEWARTFGRQRTYRITGVTTHSSLMLPKILWIRKHLPAASQIHRFVTAAELAVAALGVPPQMDWATASTTMMLDITARTWSPEILEAAGIEPALLPPVCPLGSRDRRDSPARLRGIGPEARLPAGGRRARSAGLRPGSRPDRPGRGHGFAGDGRVHHHAVRGSRNWSTTCWRTTSAICCTSTATGSPCWRTTSRRAICGAGTSRPSAPATRRWASCSPICPSSLPRCSSCRTLPAAAPRISTPAQRSHPGALSGNRPARDSPRNRRGTELRDAAEPGNLATQWDRLRHAAGLWKRLHRRITCCRSRPTCCNWRSSSLRWSRADAWGRPCWLPAVGMRHIRWKTCCVRRRLAGAGSSRAANMPAFTLSVLPCIGSFILRYDRSTSEYSHVD